MCLCSFYEFFWGGGWALLIYSEFAFWARWPILWSFCLAALDLHQCCVHCCLFFAHFCCSEIRWDHIFWSGISGGGQHRPIHHSGIPSATTGYPASLDATIGTATIAFAGSVPFRCILLLVLFLLLLFHFWLFPVLLLKTEKEKRRVLRSMSADMQRSLQEKSVYNPDAPT